MNRQFEKIIKLHEKEDVDYIYDKDEILSRVRQEFVNADEFIAYLEKDKDFADKFFDYSLRPLEYPILPIKKTSGFYIKKHTSTQTPYFHKHLFYEIIYVHRGKCVQFFPDKSELTAYEKQIAVVPPDSVHAIDKCKDNVVFKINVPEDMFGRCAKGTGLEDLSSGVKILGKADERAQEFVCAMMCEDFYRRENWITAAEKYLSLLFVALSRSECAVDDRLQERLNKYFSSGLKDASLAGFAKFSGYSTGYAGRYIKKVFSKSFSQLLQEERLRLARRLLADTELPVESIALETGYTNASGFYKLFCNTYGMTPADFRRARVKR